MGILLIYVLLLITVGLIVTLAAMKKRRFCPCDWLDKNHTTVIKGLSIVFVVLGHIGNANGVRITAPLGGMGVACFLICSGFGINCSAKKHFSPLKYWIKRIVNVMLPYLIVRTIVTVISGSFDFVSFILDITLISPRYPFGWYLQFIMIWYGVFFVAQLAAKRTSAVWKLLILSAASIACFFLAPTELQAEQSVSFLLGVILSEYYDKAFDLIKKRSVLWIALLAVLGAAAFAVKQVFPMDPGYPVYVIQLIYKLFWAVLVIIVVYYILQKCCLDLFLWIGTAAYEVYLVHGYMFDWLSVYYGIPLFIVCVAVSSYALHYCMNIVNKLVYKKWIN